MQPESWLSRRLLDKSSLISRKVRLPASSYIAVLRDHVFFVPDRADRVLAVEARRQADADCSWRSLPVAAGLLRHSRTMTGDYQRGGLPPGRPAVSDL